MYIGEQFHSEGIVEVSGGGGGRVSRRKNCQYMTCGIFLKSQEPASKVGLRYK